MKQLQLKKTKSIYSWIKTVMIIGVLFFWLSGSAQQGAYFDPAQAYNRLLIEKNNGSYVQVGNYKVTGTSYLYGEKNKGDIYAPGETGKDISLSYDTYTQNVHFYPSGNPDLALTKEPSTLDSFRIKKNKSLSLDNDITFIFGKLLGGKDKSYYQLISRGSKVNLYKKYSSELRVVTTNIVQSELREFNIIVDYYYTDSTGSYLKKLKVNPKNLAKEFAHIKDLSSFINADELVSMREQELVRVFGEVNR